MHIQWAWDPKTDVMTRYECASFRESLNIALEHCEPHRTVSIPLAKTYWRLPKVRVSTVFIALQPLWYDVFESGYFETMVFGEVMDQHQWRCQTPQEARRQHETACELVRQNVAMLRHNFGVKP